MRASTVVQTGSHQLRVPRVTADPQASFVAEGAEAPVTDPTVDQLTITPAKAVGLTVITNELAADSSPSALQVVGDGLLRDLIRVVDKAFFANTTASGPAGLLSITPTRPTPVTRGPTSTPSSSRKAMQNNTIRSSTRSSRTRRPH